MRYFSKIRGKPGLLSCSTIVRTSHWNTTLLPITLSLGLGCLLGTYRIQIWSKLRHRLRTITTLVHHSNYVSSCCTGTKYLLLQCVPQTFERAWIHNSKSLIIPSGNCTSWDHVGQPTPSHKRKGAWSTGAWCHAHPILIMPRPLIARICTIYT